MNLNINSTITSIDLLDAFASIIPEPLYWHDINGVVLGANDKTLEAIGASPEIIGQTPYHFYPHDTAELILTHNELIIKNERPSSQVEYIHDITRKQPKAFYSSKSPLYNNNRKCIGIVGISFEITNNRHLLQMLESYKNKAKDSFIIKMLKLNATKREIDVAILLLQGFISTKAIADQLTLSTRTVEVYLNNLKIKTGQYSKEALIRYFNQLSEVWTDL
jgi:DNA-binding CsgD family transcriptional regulator